MKKAAKIALAVFGALALLLLLCIFPGKFLEFIVDFLFDFRKLLCELL